MWGNFLSFLYLVYSVVGTFDNSISFDTNIQCPAITRKENERMYPPKIHGVWTSPRCEIRPGPEFILRKYVFRRKRFKLYQFYYFDPECSRPKYSIVAEGSIKLKQLSWVVQGGTEVDYRLDNVTVTPYNKHFAKKLNKKFQLNCKPLYGLNVKRFKSYQILNFPRYNKGKYKKYKDYDCLDILSLSFHELQLLKVEIQHGSKSSSPSHGHYIYNRISKRGQKPSRLLYLGNIHTDLTQRMSYRPSSFQTPLFKANTKDCLQCRKIKKAKESKPPRMRKLRGHIHMVIDGHWTSMSCETRSYGQFVRRSLVFHPNGVSWEGEYNFYRDPDCKHRSLSVFVAGDYIKERESRIITGTFDYKFNITQMSIIPRDYFTANTLNHVRNNTCGISGLWKLDSKQSVVSSKGCDILGLRVPTTEYEIIRLETRGIHDVLLVGSRPTDGKTLSKPDLRPTSLQPPLVRCMAERTNNELPQFG